MPKYAINADERRKMERSNHIQKAMLETFSALEWLANQDKETLGFGPFQRTAFSAKNDAIQRAKDFIFTINNC